MLADICEIPTITNPGNEAAGHQLPGDGSNGTYQCAIMPGGVALAAVTCHAVTLA